MAEHYKTLSAVFPIILKLENEKKQVLLSKRANTGYMDGMWDFAGSGHVDEGETAIQAVIRESKEEMGITIASNNVKFAHLTHRLGRNGKRTYYDIYFIIENFEGEPSIAEPEKCSNLKWFNIDCLPPDIITIRKNALELCLNSEYYSELVEE
jgi:ADP-ribose pyrophosphatase